MSVIIGTKEIAQIPTIHSRVVEYYTCILV